MKDMGFKEIKKNALPTEPELTIEELLPLGYDFANGKYRKFVYHKERYQRIKHQLAESRGPVCPWCGKRQVERQRATQNGYHPSCWRQKTGADSYIESLHSK